MDEDNKHQINVYCIAIVLPNYQCVYCVRLSVNRYLAIDILNTDDINYLCNQEETPNCDIKKNKKT